MKKVLFVTITCFVILLVLLVIYFGKDIFIVKNVNIEKNFNIDNKKLLEYLGITRDKFIWSYNTSEMENKLSKDINLSYYKVTANYPDSIIIKLYIREPVANISGYNGKVYFIDDKGAVFSKYDINYHIPLIIFNKNISLGHNTQNGIIEVVNNLRVLKNGNKGLYDSISQIEIKLKNDGLCDFVVNYKTINNRIYLKNSINVDLLKRGLVCALYLAENGLSGRDVQYSGAGFVF